MIRNFFLFIFIITFFVVCQSPVEKKIEITTTTTNQEKMEAREDSIALINAYAAQEKIEWFITPDVETRMIRATSEDDAADDPAIWKHPTESHKSLVFGSNKKGGLATYNLSGTEVAYYSIGNINNVDVLYNFPLNGSLITVLGCTNRTSQGINLFEINPQDGSLENIAADSLLVDQDLIDDIYGFCFAKDETTQKFYAVINGKNGLMQQFEMKATDSKIALKLSRSVQFDSQTEGMTADTESGFLYVGEEAKGIWKLSISPTNSDKSFLHLSDDSNPNIAYDIEGLTIFGNYLIASSQGNFSYAIFELEGDNRYLTSFKITNNDNIDGVEETDGLDVIGDSISVDFPNGMLVLQDGFNFENGQQIPQNFKYVRLEKVLNILKR